MEECIQIAILENEVEAALLGQILQERQIPNVINTFADSVYDRLFQFQKGWGCVVAPQSYKEEIIATLNELRGGTNQTTDSDSLSF